MEILVFLGIPLLIWVAVMLFASVREKMGKRQPPKEQSKDKDKQAVVEKPSSPMALYPDGPPRYTLDYNGNLWIEKKRKRFFRPVRRPGLPPDEPPN